MATSVEKLQFMDGPFSLEVSITEHGTVRLASIHSKLGSKSRIDRGCCGLADMMETVQAASRAILAWASNAGIHTQELKLLAETLYQCGHYKA